MKKINKRSVFSLVLCAMLVFSAGFYSSAEPTTAWFSDSDYAEKQYAMHELDVTFTGEGMAEGSAKLEFSFNAATKFDDAAERAAMFEHAARYYVFTAESDANNNLDAMIKVDLKYDNTQDDVIPAAETDKGLRYFVYEINTTDDVRTADVELVPNVWVDAEDNCLVRQYENGVETFYDSKLADKIDESITDQAAFDGYTDEQKLDFLKTIQGTNEPLKHGEKKTYCLCLWVDYDAFLDQADTIEATGIRDLTFDVDVKISAEQYDKTVLSEN